MLSDFRYLLATFTRRDRLSLVLYVLVVGFGFFAISTYLRFKELELKLAKLARAVALNEADRRDVVAAPESPEESGRFGVTDRLGDVPADH